MLDAARRRRNGGYQPEQGDHIAEEHLYLSDRFSSVTAGCEGNEFGSARSNDSGDEEDHGSPQFPRI